MASEKDEKGKEEPADATEHDGTSDTREGDTPQPVEPPTPPIPPTNPGGGATHDPE